MKTLRYAYGNYRLVVEYRDGFAQVTMSDVSILRFPMLWSVPMTKEQANGAIELFKAVGYFDMAWQEVKK